jgi:UDP-4-amino-4,6-dideoxy-N-acetyl-beta-L-altrosamine transaminase
VIRIPYGRQSIDDDDVRAEEDVLRSDWLTQGPTVERFEGAVAGHCGARHAVAVNSATSALHLACRAAGMGPGDTLWTSPITFVASANCALYCGAGVDFVDIDPATANLSTAALEKKLERTRKTGGTLPKVVVPVHFAGQSCDMEPIARMAGRYGFTVIEDASHAIGGVHRDRPVGCCAWSDMAVFSFHPVKIVTTGEGGMVVTNRDDLKEKVALLRSHGITRDPERMECPEEGSWYYEQVDLGYNFRMTDIQAALGASQMKRLRSFVDRRNKLAKRYDTALAGLPLRPIVVTSDNLSAFHLYVIRIEPSARVSRREVFEHLASGGINAQVHYIPVHTQPWYRKLGFKAGDFPAAEAHYREALTLPLYPGLTEAQQDKVVAVLREILG